MKSNVLQIALYLTAGLCSLSIEAQNLTVTTIAGGASGFLDGSNAAAQFSDPTSVAVDSAGNVYVADKNNNAIRKLTPVGTAWVTTTLAGGTQGSRDGDNETAQFYAPSGIAVDSDGVLYVSDSYNSTIRRIAQSGTNWVVTTIAGSAGMPGHVDGVNSAARFTGPAGIAVDAAGNLYVADQGNNCIRRITHAGGNWTTTTIAGGTQGNSDGTGTAAQFFSPSGVAVGGTGNIYVSDLLNNIIRLITPSGGNWVVTTIAGNSVAGRSDGVGSSAEFDTPADVAVDGSGNVYVADLFNNAIRKIVLVNGNWTVTTIAGGTLGSADGTGSGAEFALPYGVAADAYGDVIVADSQNDAIRLGIPTGTPASTGGVRVEITPAGAVSAGAGWQLDGGTVQTSGTVLTGLTPGTHSVSYTGARGYTAPATQMIPVTARQTNEIAGIYSTATANAGSLQVVLSPSGAVAAGAMWQVDNGTFKTNGAIVGGLGTGTHTISFNTIPNWASPESESVNITNAQTTLAEGEYVKLAGSLQVTILPGAVITAGAKWQVDGGTFRASGSTLSGLTPGTHTLSFNTVLGWATPVNQTISVTNGQTTATTGVYVQEVAGTSSLQVMLLPAGAVTAGAQWSVDGGLLMASGATVSSLPPGLHAVTFSTISGWSAPAGLVVTTTNGQTTVAMATYTAATGSDSIVVTILPPAAVAAGAEWQVDGGAYQTSGATVSGLTAGIHTVGFANITGWTAPAPQEVTVVDARPTSISVAYKSGSDKSKPIVIITTPAPNMHVTSPQIVVQGKASEKTGIAQVLFQLNGGGFQPATGTSNWTADLTLVPGPNIVQVEAVANSGTESVMVSRTFSYIVTSPLTVLVSGSGKVTPSLSGHLLTVGTRYTLTAQPLPGNLFSNWSGSLDSNAAVLKFIMQSNMVLQANFVPNPFVPEKGSFAGLFYDTNGVAPQSSGLFNLTLQPTGAFSMSLQFAGGRFNSSGQFDLTGSAVRTVGPLTVNMQLDFNNHLSGTISTATWSAALTAGRAVFGANNKAINFMGDYTMAIPGVGDGSVSPTGYSYASLSVSPLGGIAMKGSLADGTTINQTANVDGDGQWPLFTALPGGGEVLGWITFSNEPASSLGGAVTWIRPASRTLRYYPGGFTNQSDAIGSSYRLTHGVPVVTLSVGEATLSGLPLTTPISDAVSINNNSVLTVIPGGEHLALTLTGATGAINGTFHLTGTTAPLAVHGVILQQQNQALGYFLGASENGTFQIQ